MNFKRLRDGCEVNPNEAPWVVYIRNCDLSTGCMGRIWPIKFITLIKHTFLKPLWHENSCGICSFFQSHFLKKNIIGIFGNKTEIPSVSKMTRKLTHSTFIDNSLQSLNSYLMTIPRKRQFWQSLMTKLTIPNFPLWQSLIRNLTILISPNDNP